VGSQLEDVISVLEMLCEYYNAEPSEAQLRVYMDLLCNLEPWALKEAAYAWICRSPFFPKVSELLQAAREIPPPQPNFLFIELLELENDFYHRRVLNPEAFLDLAKRCERAGRVHTAQHARDRLALFQSMLEGEEDEPG
jgi:hypothetical protein